MLVLRLALALLFAAIGVAGLLLPILPGWLFFVLAFAVLMPRHRWTKAAVAKVERRLPRIARFLRWCGIG